MGLLIGGVIHEIQDQDSEKKGHDVDSKQGDEAFCQWIDLNEGCRWDLEDHEYEDEAAMIIPGVTPGTQQFNLQGGWYQNPGVRILTPGKPGSAPSTTPMPAAPGSTMGNMSSPGIMALALFIGLGGGI